MPWLLALLAATGCAGVDVGVFGIVAADPVPDPVTVLATHVEGADCAVDPLGLGVARPSYRAAVLRAIDTVPGATLMTNVSVEYRTWEFILFQIHCARVSGGVGRF